MLRGDVYWVALDPTRGGEIRKTRPAVIISNNSANNRLNRVQIVPLTSNATRVFPSEAIVMLNGRPSKAIADQIRTVAKERISDYSGTLSPRDIQEVEQAIRWQLGLH